MITSSMPVTPPVVANPPNAVQSAPKAAQSAAKAQPATAAVDTVQISAAAQVLQEATETPAQTTKEASSGDHQAQRLLAREAAEKASA
jgi:hypothetical protein